MPRVVRSRFSPGCRWPRIHRVLRFERKINRLCEGYRLSSCPAATELFGAQHAAPRRPGGHDQVGPHLHELASPRQRMPRPALINCTAWLA